MTPAEIEQRRQLFAEHPGRPDVAKAKWKQVRARAFARRCNTAGFDWERDFPPEIVAWARAKFAEHMKGLDCVDNARLCRLTGKRAGNAQYKARRRRGCCGFYDVELWGPDRELYKLGFNYGH